jgi:hypothetical protein
VRPQVVAPPPIPSFHPPELPGSKHALDYGGWFVLLGLTLGAGVGLGYLFWGDAVKLRTTNVELARTIVNATADKEIARHQLVAAQQALTGCQSKIDAAKP